MEGSISSDDCRDDPDFVIICFCGEPAPLIKSRTPKNPGRRFFGCAKYLTGNGCGFFCWYEPSIGQARSDLGPISVQTKTNALRTVEQWQSSDKNKKMKTIVSDSGTVMDRSVWRNLPPEIIDHVLSLLPVKYLCRFKCVSPSWNSLISSPNFAKIHLHITNNTPNKPQKTLLISSSCDLPRDLYSVDFSAVNLTAEKLDFGVSVRDPYNQVCSWGSCNGLVLISDEGINYDLFLLNPFTREWKELPDSPLVNLCCYDDMHFFVNGLGYDSSTDDYKVVILLYRDITYSNGPEYVTNAAVYSLKTDVWRRIQDPRYDPVGHGHGVCFNERIHWLCRRTNGSIVVVAFDLWDEIFREVHLPTLFTSYDIYTLGFDFKVVARSCLCLVVSPYKGGQIDVWMMMKYGVSESWTKFTIAHGMSLEDVLYLAAEEEFVLRMVEKVSGAMIQPGREKLIVYNPKNETLRDKVVCGIPTEYTVGGNYIETLVSPNHGGRIWRHCEASLGDSSKSYQLIAKEHQSSDSDPYYDPYYDPCY
ncbi:F-box/kelch-repeat protein At3g06240-like isoform X2 [Rhododendron vialii]|uniref:F-box/kelch-repeat protein At3g06240-like isoform X2 n=1 Tax=Rhododendron vialii TaxID=182163 RepID=UPI00265DDF71|nr:F-box/kelch-repeat protein At3g06240-like isoform X2 [Rhododendron vialii]